MSNVHGLFSNKKDDDDSEDESNNRYVGGVGERGGGSGLAVQPNNNTSEGAERDMVFGLAQSAAPDERNQIRRTITMYRDGFQVDDGPYRRLDDPANTDFLRALASGRTPAELLQTTEGDHDDDDDADAAADAAADGGGGGNVVVGLIDKRSQAFPQVEETFQSFSGAGTSLGSGTAAASADGADGAAGLFDPATLPATPPVVDDAQPTTSIAVRTIAAGRRVIRLNLSSTVRDLATHIVRSSDAGGSDNNNESFYLAAGYPHQTLTDPNQTIEAAGLKGAQVSMKK